MLTSFVMFTPVKLAVLPEPLAMVPPDHAAVSFHALPFPSQVPVWAEAEETASNELPAARRKERRDLQGFMAGISEWLGWIRVAASELPLLLTQCPSTHQNFSPLPTDPDSPMFHR
jgi:hypothetical protein